MGQCQNDKIAPVIRVVERRESDPSGGFLRHRRVVRISLRSHNKIVAAIEMFLTL
jgi:hypothetical protein